MYNKWESKEVSVWEKRFIMNSKKLSRCTQVTARKTQKTRAGFPNIKTSMGYIVLLQHRIYRGNKFSASHGNVNFISFVDFSVIPDFINPTLHLHATKH